MKKNAEDAKSSKTPRRRRLVLRIIAAVVVVLVVLVVTAVLARDFIVRKAICGIGSQLTGTTVTVDDFSSQLSGRVVITGLRIGNPAGYKSPEAMSFRRLTFDMSLWSIFTDTIEINLIAVEGMHVDFEPRVETASSNLGDIMNNLERFSAASEGEVTETDAAVPEEEVASEGKQLVIHRLAITDNMLTFSNALLDVTLELPMPDLNMTELGGEGGNYAETIKEILIEIAAAVAVVADVSPGEVIQDVGDTLDKAGNDILNVIKSTAGSIVEDISGTIQPRKK